MKEGRHPSSRHDGLAWGDDKARAAVAGTEFGFSAILLFLKGDWSEYVHTFGFPQWSDSVRPCYCCNAFPDTLYEFEGASPLGLPFRPNEDGDYEEACRRCEIIVILSRDSRDALLVILEIIPSKGYVLTAPVPRLHLLRGDRLEPSDALVDTHALGDVDHSPSPIHVLGDGHGYIDEAPKSAPTRRLGRGPTLR